MLRPLPRLAALCLAAWPALAAAQDDASSLPLPMTAPLLGAASNFGQGVQPGMLRNAVALGVTDLRDGLNWGLAQTRADAYDFSDPRTAYPRDVLDAGLSLSLTLNWGNPLWEGGDTPVTPEGIAAFGRFAGALARQYPGLDAVEIGNEFNSADFLRGPLETASATARAEAHAALLAAAAQVLRAEDPAIRLLGGASHSIPLGYLWAVLDAGGAAHMDALAMHPYTTPPEQLARQVAVLRRHPKAASLPIEITEFGSADPAAAAGYMLRDYCQMALSGVTRAVWYPLNPRGDGLVPLMTADGRITGAGRAFRIITGEFAGREVRDAAPDPFTYGCRFGEDTMLLWGAPRELRVADGIELRDPEGRVLAPPYALSRETPLILRGTTGRIDIGDGVELGPQRLIADSFDQFGYPAADGTPPEGDPFERFLRIDGREAPLATMPGQEAGGTLWTPYLGDPGQRPLRLTADQLLPGRSAAHPVEIVHRWTAPEPMRVALTARFDVAARSEDGITVALTRNGEEIAAEESSGVIEIAPPPMPLAAGDVLEIAVGPGGSAAGDVTEYRITLRVP